MNPQILQLGAVAIIFALAIKEFFGYLKTRKNGNGNYGKMIQQLKTMNDNHLRSIGQDINTGNDRIVDAIKDMHTDLAKELGEIKGRLR